MRTESTTEPIPPVNRLGLHQLIQHFDEGLSGVPPTQSKTMRELMKPVTDRLIVPARSLDLYDIRRLPTAARTWLMDRFTRVL